MKTYRKVGTPRVTPNPHDVLRYRVVRPGHSSRFRVGDLLILWPASPSSLVVRLLYRGHMTFPVNTDHLRLVVNAGLISGRVVALEPGDAPG